MSTKTNLNDDLPSNNAASIILFEKENNQL